MIEAWAFYLILGIAIIEAIGIEVLQRRYWRLNKKYGELNLKYHERRKSNIYGKS